MMIYVLISLMILVFTLFAIITSPPPRAGEHTHSEDCQGSLIEITIRKEKGENECK